MFINRSQLGQTGPSCPTGRPTGPNEPNGSQAQLGQRGPPNRSQAQLGQMGPMGPRPNWAKWAQQVPGPTGPNGPNGSQAQLGQMGCVFSKSGLRRSVSVLISAQSKDLLPRP